MSGFPDPFYQHPQFYPPVTPATEDDDSQAAGHDPHADSLGPPQSLLDYSQSSGPYALGQFQEVYDQSLQDPDFFARVRSGPLLTAQQQQTQQPQQNQQNQQQTQQGYSIRNTDDLSNNVYNAWSGVGGGGGVAAGNVFPYEISDAYSMPSLASQQMYSTFPTQSSAQNPYWDVGFQNTTSQEQTVVQEQYSRSYSSLQPRAIQPKPQAQVTGLSLHLVLQVNWLIKKDRLPPPKGPFDNVYSSSGFDIMGALVSLPFA